MEKSSKRNYRPWEIEPKWQKIWQEKGIYRVVDKVSGKKNYYCLVMFPYSSGNLHIGHWYNFAPADVFARYQRMRGKNVLHPMGFDAFGLPAEGAAVREKIHPAVWTKGNIQKMTAQLKTIGAIYDWSRMVNTSDPEYYRWTQWMFLQMFKNGLAYKARSLANWCPNCQSILANEQAEGGKCWRCEGPVEQREIEQWFLKITKYADELLEDLKKLNWPEKTLVMQKNWIGRTEGIIIDYPVVSSKKVVSCYSTRPDTNFGATFVVIAPEHPMVSQLTTPENKESLSKYIKISKKKSELERISLEKEKTGIFTGSYALNRLTGKKMPIWVSDFVVLTAGTGIVVGVPAHDKRDWQFGRRYGLEMIPVLKPAKGSWNYNRGAFTDINDAIVFNSDFLNGLPALKAKEKIIDYLVKKDWGERAVNYHLRDWLVSRQRYWGAPIPIIYCQKCGPVPVPEKDLPVLLPKINDFTPKEGTSPLARCKGWVKVACPECGGAARRETDTMDTFVCSSWYYLRYTDSKNKKQFANPKKIKTWLPVDMYIGGAEHAVLHLLYSRFFTKALRDFGYLDFAEPFLGLRHQGVILGEDGFKMSKSRGNVIDPDNLVRKFGADTVRIYLGFMGPYEQGGPWSSKGIMGIWRFLNRVWKLAAGVPVKEYPLQVQGEIRRIMHKTIKKVGEDIEKLHFNTAVSALMEYVNFLIRTKEVSREAIEILVLLLAPFAPHLSEELWQQIGANQSKNQRSSFKSVHQQPWPKYNPKLIEEEMVTIVIQVNGKVRGQIQISSQASGVRRQVEKLAKKEKNVAKYLTGKKIKKTIFVPGRLINFVV